MAFSDQRPTNVGCIVAAIIMIPLAFVVFIAGSMSGGGCEGAPAPCEGDYTPMWMEMAGLVVAGFILAKSINALVSWASTNRRD